MASPVHFFRAAKKTVSFPHLKEIQDNAQVNLSFSPVDPSIHLPQALPIPDRIEDKRCQSREERTKNRYWGNVKPFYFEMPTEIPRVVISPGFTKSLIMNLLIILIICAAIPISTNIRLFPQIKSSITSSRNLGVEYEPSKSNLLLAATTIQIGQYQYEIKKLGLFFYSFIWTIYSLILYLLLLLGNPGYGEPEEEKIVAMEDLHLITSKDKVRNMTGYNQCDICKTLVDNSVFHCQICDLCCEGFSHHCEWVGKCIGYKNRIYLKAYVLGFPIGLLGMVVVIVLQSLL